MAVIPRVLISGNGAVTEQIPTRRQVTFLPCRWGALNRDIPAASETCAIISARHRQGCGHRFGAAPPRRSVDRSGVASPSVGIVAICPRRARPAVEPRRLESRGVGCHDLGLPARALGLGTAEPTVIMSAATRGAGLDLEPRGTSVPEPAVDRLAFPLRGHRRCPARHRPQSPPEAQRPRPRSPAGLPKTQGLPRAPCWAVGSLGACQPAERLRPRSAHVERFRGRARGVGRFRHPPAGRSGPPALAGWGKLGAACSAALHGPAAGLRWRDWP